MNSRYHPIQETFICQDCVFVFSLHSPREKWKMPYCPKCGDNIAVKPFKQQKYKQHRFWSEEELKLIDRIVNGELLAYQVASKLGRSSKSIQRRVQRRKEEINI